MSPERPAPRELAFHALDRRPADQSPKRGRTRSAPATLRHAPNHFVGSVAANYDADSPEMFQPELLATTADFLAAEARGGRAFEFGIGTGRVALPLSQRGVPVHGIDISADMIDQLRGKPGSETRPDVSSPPPPGTREA